MSSWPDKVFIFEINTWVWLTTLSEKYQRRITLSNIPDEEIDDIARPNVDFIWLMGVWKRSELGRKNALKYKHEYVDALPDITDADIIGSAYSIGDYSVDERVGGRAGLARFRKQLQARKLRLLLDYVPNHVGMDHPWIEKPGFIIRGQDQDARRRPSDFFLHKDKHGVGVVLAHGRDPLFPGWSDTAQLDAFNPELRRAVTETLLDIAQQCDGVRCDMAMLMMNEIFSGTWSGYVGPTPTEDYWPAIIPKIKARYPDFKFIAEVYWDKEYAVLQQGFDFAYDKRLYDRIIEGDIAAIRAHLVADIRYQMQLVRFIENHDEPRAYSSLGAKKSFPAATLICTLPGACLLHQGQFTGRRAKLPVHIRRQPVEPEDHALFIYYEKLLQETREPIYHHGEFYLFETRMAGGGDASHSNLIAYGWRDAGKALRLVIVNLTGNQSYARIPLGHWAELAGKKWQLHDVIDNSVYERDGGELCNAGLFVDLRPYESHIFRIESR